MSVTFSCTVCHTEKAHVAFELPCEACGLRHGEAVRLPNGYELRHGGVAVKAIVIHGRGVDRFAESKDTRNLNPASRWRVAAFCEFCRREAVRLAKANGGGYVSFQSREVVEDLVAKWNETSRLVAERRRECQAKEQTRKARLATFVGMATRR